MAIIWDAKLTRLCIWLTALPLSFCRLDSSKQRKGAQAASVTGTPRILSMHFMLSQVSRSNQYQFLFPYSTATSGYYLSTYLSCENKHKIQPIPPFIKLICFGTKATSSEKQSGENSSVCYGVCVCVCECECVRAHALSLLRYKIIYCQM